MNELNFKSLPIKFSTICRLESTLLIFLLFQPSAEVKFFQESLLSSNNYIPLNYTMTKCLNTNCTVHSYCYLEIDLNRCECDCGYKGGHCTGLNYFPCERIDTESSLTFLLAWRLPTVHIDENRTDNKLLAFYSLDEINLFEGWKGHQYRSDKVQGYQYDIFIY